MPTLDQNPKSNSQVEAWPKSLLVTIELASLAISLLRPTVFILFTKTINLIWNEHNVVVFRRDRLLASNVLLWRRVSTQLEVLCIGLKQKEWRRQLVRAFVSLVYLITLILMGSFPLHVGIQNKKEGSPKIFLIIWVLLGL